MNKHLQRILPYLKQPDEDGSYYIHDDFKITYDGHEVVYFNVYEDGTVDINYAYGVEHMGGADLNDHSFSFLQLWEAKEF